MEALGFSACVFILTIITQGWGQFSDMSGEDIVNAMQTMPDKCPANTTNGQNWAPLPKGTECGSTQRCDFPNQWCAFKPGPDGNPDLSTLNCQALSDTCKQAFKDVLGGGASGGPTPPPPEGSPPPTLPEGAPPTPPPMESVGTPPAMETPPSAPPPLEASSGGPEVSPPPSGGGECCDYHEFCCFWASQGECSSNKHFMNTMCQKSCGTCGCSGDTNSCSGTPDQKCSGPGIGPDQACPCTSAHPVNRDWNPSCAGWAANGECDKNAAYMKPICKISCKVCT